MTKAIVLAVLLLSAIVSACLTRTAAPDAGHEIVLVKKPLIFGHGGVDPEPVRTGLTFIAWTTDKHDVSVQPIQETEHFEDLMSSDGVPLDFDAVLRVQVTNSVALIRDFGPGWFKNNVQAEFRNRVRQAVRKHGMNETAISTAAIEQIDDEVTKTMNQYLAEAKLPVRLIQVTVGKANPPDSIKNQRIETAAQQQRVLTEQQRKLAEDSRKSAELSRAEADNAYRNAMQLSPEQFLNLERIKMQRDVCGAGKTGCTFILSGAGAVSPIIDARAH